MHVVVASWSRASRILKSLSRAVVTVVQVAFVGMLSTEFDVARSAVGGVDSPDAQQLLEDIVAFTDTQCPVVLCVPGSQAPIVTAAL